MLAFTLFPLKDSNLKGWSEGNSTKNRSRKNREANGIWPLLPFNTREKTQRQWLENSIFITCSLYFQRSSGSSHLKPTVLFQILSPCLVPWGNCSSVFLNSGSALSSGMKMILKPFGELSLPWLSSKNSKSNLSSSSSWAQVFTCIFKWLLNYVPSEVTEWSTVFSYFGVVYYEVAKSEEGGQLKIRVSNTASKRYRLTNAGCFRVVLTKCNTVNVGQVWKRRWTKTQCFN